MEQITLTREELYRQIWEQPLSILARKYMYSEASFRNLCISMSIPVPREGHWEKIRSGKQVTTPALSANYQGPATVTFQTRAEKVKQKKTPAESNATQKTETAATAIITTSAFRLPVDKLVISASKVLRSKTANQYDGMVSCPHGELSIVVTPLLVERALTFMDALIKAVRARGHDLAVRPNKTCVLVFQQELEIRCREKSNRITIKEGKYPTHAFRPSGVLIFKLEGLHGREWMDGSRLIDEQIPSMLDKFETEARREIEWKQKAEKNRLEEQERNMLKREREQHHTRELAASRQLIQRALRWERALALRRYITELRNRATAGGSTLTDDMQTYLEWATKKADWYDPFINAEDEFLSDQDREAIEQPVARESAGFGFGYTKEADYFPGRNWYQK